MAEENKEDVFLCLENGLAQVIKGKNSKNESTRWMVREASGGCRKSNVLRVKEVSVGGFVLAKHSRISAVGRRCHEYVDHRSFR